MAVPSESDVIAERYRLLAEIGRGGMGTVWRGRDERLSRDVAIKLMAPDLKSEPGMLARFEREAKAVANLTSPHIVQIHDFGVDPQPFMVMELLRGTTLGERLERDGVLTPAETATIVSQTARALATAHEAGIIHRDLKPGNLFIVRDRDQDLVKVVDFGIAKAVFGRITLQKITAVGEALGTPKYMSPEQLAANGDHRDDIWALAVIAYCCMTKGHPFEAGSLVETVARIQNGHPTPISHFDRSLPPALDAMFERALHKQRGRRFQRAEDLARALERAAAGVPATKRIGATTLPMDTPLLDDPAEVPTEREGHVGADTIPERRAALAPGGQTLVSDGPPPFASPSSTPPPTIPSVPPSSTLPSIPPSSTEPRLSGPPHSVGPSVPPPPARSRPAPARAAPWVSVVLVLTVVAALVVWLLR